MSTQSLTTPPPLVATHEELMELDKILDGCNHGFAKQIIQWVNWVRQRRNQEVQEQRQSLDEQAKEAAQRESMKMVAVPSPEPNGQETEVIKD